uniref:Odorant receptor n=1 Tax=Phlebotomus papatasi TaxID=29031 RepID=A0A3F2ZEN1_PHLPP
MSEFLECYEQYLDYEKEMRLALKVITLSFWEGYIFNRFGKFLLPLICLYISASCLAALFISNADLLQKIMTILISIGMVQVSTKVMSIPFFKEDLNKILLWLKDIHRIRQIDFVNHSAQENLKTSFKFTKMIPKILILGYLGAVSTYMSYFAYVGKVVIAVPGLVPIAEEYLVFYCIHQFLSNITAVSLICVTDYIAISIAIYIAGAFNILHDMIKCLNDSELVEKEREFLRSIYIFHNELNRIFKNFLNIFYYSFFAQYTSTVGFLIFLFFLLNQNRVFFIYACCVTVLTQLGFLCWFGEVFCAKTGRIFNDLYMTKWYELSLKEQKVVLITMQGSQRAFGFKLAGMFQIDLVMFVQVIKLCFSCYAVLLSLT